MDLSLSRNIMATTLSVHLNSHCDWAQEFTVKQRSKWPNKSSADYPRSIRSAISLQWVNLFIISIRREQAFIDTLFLPLSLSPSLSHPLSHSLYLKTLIDRFKG